MPLELYGRSKVPTDEYSTGWRLEANTGSYNHLLGDGFTTVCLLAGIPNGLPSRYCPGQKQLYGIGVLKCGNEEDNVAGVTEVPACCHYVAINLNI